MSNQNVAVGDNVPHSFPLDSKVCCGCGIQYLTEEQKIKSNPVSARKGICVLCKEETYVVDIINYNNLVKPLPVIIEEPKPQAPAEQPKEKKVKIPENTSQLTVRLTGKLKKIFPLENKAGFEKRIIWLEETKKDFANTWQIEFWQADALMLGHYKEGDIVTCVIDIRGRTWDRDGKNGVMNTLKCWNIEKDGVSFKVFDVKKDTTPVQTPDQTFDPNIVPF